MKLVFLGTRGNTAITSPRHRRHSSALVTYRGQTVMIDCGAGFLLIEAQTPDEVSEIVEPYMDLMSWDVHAVSVNDYEATMDAMRQELRTNG